MKRIRNFIKWLIEKILYTIKILRIAIFRFGGSDASLTAAGMSYYAFFSIFPLLLALVVGLSYILEKQTAYDYVIQNVFLVLPSAKELIDSNIQQVLNSRGELGLISLMGFLWSSSSFFSVLAKNINQASLNFQPIKFFGDKLVALVMIAVLALLLGLSLASNLIVSFIPQIDTLFLGEIPLNETVFVKIILEILPFLASLLLFIGLYRYIPKRKIGWKGVFYAAFFSALCLRLATILFGWLLKIGLVNYDLVYGSLGAVVSLLFWIYLICTITIFGAHLSSVIETPELKIQSSNTSQ
jgi:membrane protein